MVIAQAVGADVFLGVGWVLQQRVVARSRPSDDSSWRVLRRLIAAPLWWGGVAAMAVGQTLAAWALQSGSVTLVEPLLVGCLVCAFAFAAWRGNGRIRRDEIIGSLILLGGVALFVGAAAPRPNGRVEPGLAAILVATAAVTAPATIIVVIGKRAGRRKYIAAEAATCAAAAGMFYALQDAATRGAIDEVQRRSAPTLLTTGWPWVLLAGATAGVLVSQAAFQAGRLDWSLPPIVAVQPIVGVALGITLLGDRLRLDPLAVTLEGVSIPVTLLGVLVVGRSRALRRAHGLRRRARAQVEASGTRAASAWSPQGKRRRQGVEVFSTAERRSVRHGQRSGPAPPGRPGCPELTTARSGRHSVPRRVIQHDVPVDALMTLPRFGSARAKSSRPNSSTGRARPRR